MTNIDNVAINKIASIEKCLARIIEILEGEKGNFYHDQLRQDAIVLNLQRACDCSIDLAVHLVKLLKLGVPQSSRDSFNLLNEKRILTNPTTLQMKKMIGFRNIAVHNYQSLNLDIIYQIITNKLDDFRDFVREVKRALPK